MSRALLDVIKHFCRDIAPNNDAPPTFWARFLPFPLVFIPWLLLYEWVVYRGVQPGAFETFLPGEINWPIWPWMEVLYVSLLPRASGTTAGPDEPDPAFVRGVGLDRRGHSLSRIPDRARNRPIPPLSSSWTPWRDDDAGSVHGSQQRYRFVPVFPRGLGVSGGCGIHATFPATANHLLGLGDTGRGKLRVHGNAFVGGHPRWLWGVPPDLPLPDSLAKNRQPFPASCNS